jgi:hypothetical protein
MSVGIMFLFVLVVSVVVLSIAILVIRHQRMLAEKKSQYLNCMKQRDYHQRRYKACQVDIDKVRASHNNLLGDLNQLLIEMEEKRNGISEVLEILREESKGVDNQMEQDITRIIERRKGMLKNDWQVFNGLKASYLEKLKKALSDRQSMNEAIMKKEDEFKRWKHLEACLQQLQKEYEQIKRNPIIPFGKKKT